MLRLDPIDKRSDVFLDVLYDVGVLVLRKNGGGAEAHPATSSLLQVDKPPRVRLNEPVQAQTGRHAMAPTNEHASLLPQAMSIYAITYYLGSITRYRPQHFAKLLAGSYGEFVQEFISSQPSQFMYLMASDFAKRDVVRAPLV